MDGRSLRPLVEGRDVPWRDELFVECLFTLRDNPFQEGLRTERWKYIRMYDGVDNHRESDVDFSHRAPQFEMLFDLQADPEERNNLIGAPEHRETLDTLRRRCAEQSAALNRRREQYKEVAQVQLRPPAAGPGAVQPSAPKRQP